MVQVASPLVENTAESEHGSGRLGPLLCWAVVFADIGTSVYYVPGVLYGNVGQLAGFFVFLTMSVFVLLTLKYAEVTQRFQQGGGVVTVASQAINRWVGALGGMFILVDYFLTAAISCLSGILYFSVVFPALGPLALWITIGALILLGLLNWVGISESAKVSLVGAVIAFISDLAILVMVFTHISFGDFLALFPKMFQNQHLTVVYVLVGFAGSFLAFSGLESISQLAPVMKAPRKKVAGIALLLVVLTIGITSPLLTLISTMLLPREANDPVLNAQLISLLGGHWGSLALETIVAISASALLVFASNTAIIGAYHVFMALSRMDFLPGFILQRNRLRGTPHYSIILATGVPILVLLVVQGDINRLADMYAFGLLGAFSLTCLGLDIVRYRERRAARGTTHGFAAFWKSVGFWLGVLTTFLVMVAWSTNLVAKPAATIFGGSISLVGMGIAYLNQRRRVSQGRLPVFISQLDSRLPEATLAVLLANDQHNEAVIQSAVHQANGHPLVFLYIGLPKSAPKLGMFEVFDPYLEDEQAKRWFSKVEALMQKKAQSTARSFVYRQQTPESITNVWQVIKPRDTIVDAEHAVQICDINPDRVRFETTGAGTVAHMLKRW